MVAAWRQWQDRQGWPPTVQMMPQRQAVQQRLQRQVAPHRWQRWTTAQLWATLRVWVRVRVRVRVWMLLLTQMPLSLQVPRFLRLSRVQQELQMLPQWASFAREEALGALGLLVQQL